MSANICQGGMVHYYHLRFFKWLYIVFYFIISNFGVGVRRVVHTARSTPPGKFCIILYSEQYLLNEIFYLHQKQCIRT